MNLPNVKSPCADCPFRKDCLKGWLGEYKMREILNANSFVCHKNTELQCAGHMLLSEKSLFVELAGRLGLAVRLRGRELVFDTPEDCIKHHTNKPIKLLDGMRTDTPDDHASGPYLVQGHDGNLCTCIGRHDEHGKFTHFELDVGLYHKGPVVTDVAGWMRVVNQYDWDKG